MRATPVSAEELLPSTVREFSLGRLGRWFLDDPYPTYAALRAHAPVHRLPDGSFFLTRYDDIAHVYRDGPPREHTWSSGWVEEAVDFLISSPTGGRCQTKCCRRTGWRLRRLRN